MSEKARGDMPPQVRKTTEGVEMDPKDMEQLLRDLPEDLGYITESYEGGTTQPDDSVGQPIEWSTGWCHPKDSPLQAGRRFRIYRRKNVE